jgi:hypothetical protein
MLDFPELSEDDLRELFALFSSPTDEEVANIYSPSHRLFYKNERLDEEYSLTEEKGEYARDSWRAVLSFLDRHGYGLTREDNGRKAEAPG